ncbi:hypothetical protein [Luteimonas abyssi]|uniref:hypothetical protein n=1 Tax=Luteimonas abyssi TaxID=1247514 RepID=UPI000737D18B|nr:hypothetical protein [Luteimonas abyssi]
MKKQLALGALLALSLGFVGNAAAFPTTPCTAENEGAEEYVPNNFPRGGGAIFQCWDGRWHRVAICDDFGGCIWI